MCTETIEWRISLLPIIKKINKKHGVHNIAIKITFEVVFKLNGTMVSQNASKSCKYFEVRKNRFLILENLENFQQSE